MSDTLQVWHYGLVAQWWAEFNDSGPEIAYFQRLIERSGQPALDVACGTGRLLLPYLRAGLDVDGCDVSPDMLALCQAKAAREGLTPRLYAQATHELDLPRTYQTIYVCGGFGLGGTREQDREGLRRLYRHLEPGGVLVLDNEMPYAERTAWQWQYWLKDKRRELSPTWWPTTGTRRQTASGDEIELRSRLAELNPLEQYARLQMRAGLWRAGQLVREEEYTIRINLYFMLELRLLLEQAGFRDITLQGDYTEAEATAEHDVVVFIARK